jgi:hypothetical protein
VSLPTVHESPVGLLSGPSFKKNPKAAESVARKNCSRSQSTRHPTRRVSNQLGDNSSLLTAPLCDKHSPEYYADFLQFKQLNQAKLNQLWPQHWGSKISFYQFEQKSPSTLLVCASVLLRWKLLEQLIKSFITVLPSNSRNHSSGLVNRTLLCYFRKKQYCYFFVIYLYPLSLVLQQVACGMKP